jgi:hypothetical protein
LTLFIETIDDGGLVSIYISGGEWMRSAHLFSFDTFDPLISARLLENLEVEVEGNLLKWKVRREFEFPAKKQ